MAMCRRSRLRLSLLHETGKRASARTLPIHHYLLRLVEAEIIERERRMVDRRIKAAKFPTVKSLDSFDFTAFPDLNKALVMELARSELEYVERRENAIIDGRQLGHRQEPYRSWARPRRLPEGHVGRLHQRGGDRA